MAQNAKPAAQKPDAVSVQKSDKKTKVLIGIIVLMALVIAAGGGWYAANMGKESQHVKEVEVEAEVVPPKTPLFVVLEPFTVNLHRDSSDNDQYMQLGITLKAFESDIEAKIKTNLPEIRSKILQLLTSKTSTELLTAEGKTQLVKEIIALSNSVIGVVKAPAPSTIAASQVSETVPEAKQEKVATPLDTSIRPTAHKTAKAEAEAANKPVEPTGVVDVLFTSFIIQ